MGINGAWQKMGPGTIYSQGFALLFSGEEPSPLSLSHGFFTIEPSPSVSIGTVLFFSLFSVPSSLIQKK